MYQFVLRRNPTLVILQSLHDGIMILPTARIDELFIRLFPDASYHWGAVTLQRPDLVLQEVSQSQPRSLHASAYAGHIVMYKVHLPSWCTTRVRLVNRKQATVQAVDPVANI